MTIEEQKTKIMAAIEARGWCLTSFGIDGAKELKAEGKITLDTRYSATGISKFVWKAA